MNLQQLTVFREIMRSGSISQAARNLHRTQPAISASLKTLETDLDMPLFLREGRRLVPVPEAHYLLSEAKEVLDRISTAEQNLTALRDRRTGHLRIVAMPGPSAFLLPEFISRFIADRPEVHVTVATRSSPQVRNLISAQGFDVGFCDLEVLDEPDRLFLNESMTCNCLCALPIDHPLAAHKIITAKDLDGHPMGALQPTHSTFSNTQAAFAAMDTEFKIRVDMQYFLPLFPFIEAGQVCAVVDVLSAYSYLRSKGDAARIVFRPFKPDVPFGYSILTPHQRPLSCLAEEFVDRWRDWVKTQLKAWERPNGET
ncbi:LysR family transcriptional regulator [Sedimentitalea sp. CY04]|uniref:LysR family transcriptional regulator n=1 Tax=Parasedimentitalea denitrificans TaxID=2211118 RepID=A0ABX0WCH2_9RHOB|nr:LysR family transcriptional regulator [Sedimentitalea sp. CY04]